MTIRVGQGHDIHRFVAGRRLVLGGVQIPCEMGLLGHSDADVLVHAVMDALLGAMGQGDIGQWFPDTDPRYAGISSMKLLEQVMTEVRNRNFQVGNLDCQIFCERPRIAPHREAIRQSLANALAIPPELVNIKAGTFEQCDAVGRGEAMICQAIVLLTALAFPSS